ncbi:hypothetical protein [Compostibacter hankyongensis]|uniref:Uncharacterized protein n=1 Tax=Compostibacter hankyongensis TaxID=1007089 RepID=A0ABP8G9I7_9BACT
MNEGDILLRIEEKLKLLLKRTQQLEEERATLQQTIAIQQKILEEKENAIQEMERHSALLKIAGSGQREETPEEKRFLRQQINAYIREIDRCMALLNN